MNWLWTLILREGMSPPTNGMIVVSLLSLTFLPLMAAAWAAELADASNKEVVICAMVTFFFELFLLWLMIGRSFWWSISIKNWLAS